MIIYDSILMGADYYKAWHKDLYPDGLEKVYSVLIPRKNSFFPWSDKMVVFGYQLFAGRILVDKFNETFFNQKREDVMETYSYVVGTMLGKPASEINADHIGALHDLGYLPIKVKALKEGTEVPMGVPVLTIENTLPEFAWLPNYLETILLSETFVTSTVASVAHQFHLIGKEYGEKYADNLDYLPFQFHDFSQRGQHGVEASVLSGLGHLTSSAGTDAMSSVLLAEKYYGAKLSKELVGGSVVASEHSVMESYGLDQFHTYHELIKNNPTGILSLVSDTYDYWEVIDKVLPAEKDAIMARDGKVVIRPDSLEDVNAGLVRTLDSLYNTFGGAVNSKGLRVLEPHVGLLHGEGINLDNVRGLMDAIVEGGYSPENIVIGVGAYVYSVLVSRDSFGQAIKAQDVIIDGKEMKIFKDPALHEKKDNIDEERAMKKSLKGAVVVLKDGDHIYAKDDLTIAEADSTEGNLLHTIFEDGKQYNTQTLSEIRKELD